MVEECDFLPRITESQGGGLFERDGRLLRLMTTLEVGPWRPLGPDADASEEAVPAVMGQELAMDQLSVLELRFSGADARLAVERLDWFRPRLAEAVYQSLAAYLRERVLGAMMAATPQANRGAAAGPGGHLRLGEPGEPLIVTPGHLLAETAKLRRLLVEVGSWRSGRMWLVVPLEFYTSLAGTELARVLLDGPDMTVDGELPNRLMGFRVFVADTPPFKSGDAAAGLPILAGRRDAFLHSVALIDSEIVDAGDSEILRLKAAHGHEAVRPEALALAYWRLENDGD
jgi:hypothetical protein